MTALAKLDEIHARLKAATPGPWPSISDSKTAYATDGKPMHTTYWACSPGERSIKKAIANADLIANAPADLALLESIVREAAQMDCDYAADVIPAACASRGDACWPCRVRRELAKEGHNEHDVIGALLDRIDRMRPHLRRADHALECSKESKADPCSCGLDALLREEKGGGR